MPSGPKKRRAERKKNDTIIKTPANSGDTSEAKVEDTAEFQTADHKTIESPSMVDELIDDKINLTDIDSKKTDPSENDDVGEYDPPAMVSEVVSDDTVKDSCDPLILDSEVTIDALENMPVDSDSLKSNPVDQDVVGQEMRLLEQLVCISAEIGVQTEKQVSLAKEFSLNLSRLLEELKFSKLK